MGKVHQHSRSPFSHTVFWPSKNNFSFLAHLSTMCSGWAIVINCCLASVRLCVRPSVDNYLKNLLLWNRPTHFNETLQKWSLGDALSEKFKDMNSVKNSGCHGNRKKKLWKSSCSKPWGLELSYLACSIIEWISTKILQIMAMEWKLVLCCGFSDFTYR